jgi:hypothetical protein
MEAQVVRHMTRGLGLGGVVLLAGMASMLAGCSSLGQADQTAAIAAAAANTAVGAVDTVAQGPAVAGIGKAITLADATCDQIKAEIATFEADKIPAKLADFGKAKYHPTSEESIRFARYVDVEKAGKDKNCAPAAMKKKPIMASKTPATVDPMAAKKAVVVAKKPVPAVKGAPVVAKATPAVKPLAPAPQAVTVPVEDGVTVTVPDSSG